MGSKKNKKKNSNKKNINEKDLKEKHDSKEINQACRPTFIIALIFAIFISVGINIFAKNYSPVNEIKIDENLSKKRLKITLLNDIHATSIIKPRSGLVLSDSTTKKLDEFVRVTNDEFKPDMLVLGGDIIEGTQRPSSLGMKELELVKQKLSDVKVENKNWIIGNHDLRSVNRQQWQKALAINEMDYSLETEDYKLLFLDSNYGSEGDQNLTEGRKTNLMFSDEQINWIEQQLESTSKIKIIFMHHPPVNAGDLKPGYKLPDLEKVQGLFSKYKVNVVFGGHIERLIHQDIDGVNYYVLPGITKSEDFNNLFTEIIIRGNYINVFINYINQDGQRVRAKVE